MDPTGDTPWWEQLPAADAGSWASRASRRKERSKVRLAFICTKLRGLEEPEPFVVEIDFATDQEIDELKLRRAKLKDYIYHLVRHAPPSCPA